MPTNRTPRRHAQRSGNITPQVVGLYQRALELRAHAHLSDKDQEIAHVAERDVDRALGIRLWQTSVFDTEIYPQPGDADWERAVDLRRQLEVAAHGHIHSGELSHAD